MSNNKLWAVFIVCFFIFMIVLAVCMTVARVNEVNAQAVETLLPPIVIYNGWNFLPMVMR